MVSRTDVRLPTNTDDGFIRASHDGLVAKMFLDVSLKLGENKNKVSHKNTNIKAASLLNKLTGNKSIKKKPSLSKYSKCLFI